MMKLVENHKYLPVIREIVKSGRSVRIPICGSSMAPFLVHQRDSVIIEKPKGHLKAGDIVFYQRPNKKFVLHRIHHIDRAGYLYIIGDAQTQLEGPVNPDAVFGIVTSAKRKDHWIGPGNFWWDFFEKYWIRMIPCRRICEAFYRIVRRH